jgi:hypothetical protein
MKDFTQITQITGYMNISIRILKDYPFINKTLPIRAHQTRQHKIIFFYFLDILVKFSPVLAHTGEEVWKYA